MRFFAIFLLVAMAMAQESDETTTAATTTVIATETTTFAETTAELGTGTMVSFLVMNYDASSALNLRFNVIMKQVTVHMSSNILH